MSVVETLVGRNHARKRTPTLAGADIVEASAGARRPAHSSRRVKGRAGVRDGHRRVAGMGKGWAGAPD